MVVATVVGALVGGAVVVEAGSVVRVVGGSSVGEVEVVGPDASSDREPLGTVVGTAAGVTLAVSRSCRCLGATTDRALCLLPVVAMITAGTGAVWGARRATITGSPASRAVAGLSNTPLVTAKALLVPTSATDTAAAILRLGSNVPLLS